MSDGRWRIKQYAPNTKTGFIVTDIAVRLNPDATHPEISSPTHPWWIHDNILDGPCLRFTWEDGHEQHFPWTSIAHAEYQPPTKGENK